MAETHLIDVTGRTVFRGTQKPPGGGSPVQAVYTGASVTITNGGFAFLPFDTLSSGTDLLDRSTADSPTLLAAGLYALTLAASAVDPLTAGGFALLSALNPVAGPNQPSDHPEFGWTVTVLFVASAGDLIQAQIVNEDGVASRDFSLNNALLVKIT